MGSAKKAKMGTRAGSGFQSKGDLVYNDVIKIMSSAAHQRTKKEIQAVSEWIMKKVPLFTDMDKDLVYSVIKSCKCQVSLRDTVVVKQGDKGNAFFITLRGQVSVFVKEETKTEVPKVKKDLRKEILEAEDPEEKPPSPEPEILSANNSDEDAPKISVPTVRMKFRKSFTKLKVTQRISSKMKKVVEDIPDPRENLGHKVAVMKDGQSFGELALQNSDNKRAASCVCDTDVVFLVVARDSYNKSIRAFQHRQLAAIKSFTLQHPFFKDWPSRLQSQVQNSVTQLKLQPGMNVLRQGEVYNGIYFLLQGEVKLIMNSQNHSKQYADTMGPDKRKDDKANIEHEEGIDDKLLGHYEILHSLAVPHVQVKRRAGYAAAELHQSNRRRNLCLSGPLIMFGDIEHVLGLNTYIQTVISESVTQLFHISRDNLNRIMKLASKEGQLVCAPTVAAMAEIALDVWTNRIQKFSTATDDFSYIDRMMKTILQTSKIRTKNAEQPQMVSDQEKSFASLVTAYLNNDAQLVQPYVAGGYHYRVVMREKAELRRKVRERQGNVQLPQSLRPFKQNRIPRSIASLKEEMRKLNTSSVDDLIPKTRRRSMELKPLSQADLKAVKLQRPTSQPDYTKSRASKPLPNIVVNSPEASFHQISEQNSTEKVTSGENVAIEDNSQIPAPVLVTELLRKPADSLEARYVPRCDSLPLVEGRTLKFYSQYLRGRLDDEYNKSSVNYTVLQNNQETDALETKLQNFVDPHQATSVFKLHRLDATNSNILPGGKCLIERRPCRLMSKSLPLKSHEHVRRHMVEH